MSRKKQEAIPDLRDYVPTEIAAQLLSIANERPIRADYVPHVRDAKKHQVRFVRCGKYYLYHKDDLASCRIAKISGQRPLPRQKA